MNDNARGTYNQNSQIKFKTTMLKSSLSDYIDDYILVKGTVTVVEKGGDAAATTPDRNNKQVHWLKSVRIRSYSGPHFPANSALFTECLGKMSNNQGDNAKSLDVAMPMYNLKEYDENDAKMSGSLWQHRKNDPNNNVTFTSFKLYK